MIIRDVDISKDVEDLVKGAREFAERAYPIIRLTDDSDMLRNVMINLHSINGMNILLAENENKIVGGIAMLYAPYMWNPSMTVAEELFWFSFRGAPKETGKRLLDAVMSRINDIGAIPMFRTLATSRQGVERAYRSYGMSPIETVFSRLP